MYKYMYKYIYTQSGTYTHTADSTQMQIYFMNQTADYTDTYARTAQTFSSSFLYIFCVHNESISPNSACIRTRQCSMYAITNGFRFCISFIHQLRFILDLTIFGINYIDVFGRCAVTQIGIALAIQISTFEKFERNFCT